MVYFIARLVFYLPIPIVYKQVIPGSSRSFLIYVLLLAKWKIHNINYM